MSEDLKQLCYAIGCSGVDSKCPGNPDCQIIRNIKQLSDDIAADEKIKAINETFLKQVKL